jgi:hypothetical protein
VNFDGVAGWLSVVEVGVVELSWAAGAFNAKRASGKTWHGPCTPLSRMRQHHYFIHHFLTDKFIGTLSNKPSFTENIFDRAFLMNDSGPKDIT